MRLGTTTLLLGALTAAGAACGGGSSPLTYSFDTGIAHYPDQGQDDAYMVSNPLVVSVYDAGLPDTIGVRDTIATDASCIPTADNEDCTNEQDDDCNGLIDSQDPACQSCDPESDPQACTTDYLGVCAAGSQTCTLGDSGIWAWSECKPNVEPGEEEVCDNAEDNDCDGLTPANDPDCYCTNGKRDQDESDVDCGGGTCATCTTGHLCNEPTDCTTNQCQAPTVSGGCLRFEQTVSLYVQSGELVVGCRGDFGQGLTTQRTITITGVVVSGGCLRLEQLVNVYLQNGKVLVGCQGGLGNGNEMRREINFEGASVSGGCQFYEKATRLYVDSGRLMISCEGTLLGSGTESQRQLVITGPKTCQ